MKRLRLLYFAALFFTCLPIFQADARYYDARTGRFLSVDPKAQAYVSCSPYAYALNNPLKNIDPNGKEVILVVWATSNGHIGHAGIAVSNYHEVRGKMVPDGTYTYQDLWPGTPVGKENFNENVPAAYNQFTVTEKDLTTTDVTQSEGYAPDGAIKLSTGYTTDQGVLQALSGSQQANPNYNGLTNNCSDYARVGVEAAAGGSIGAKESLTSKTSATTPNQLYKATAKLGNATIVKDAGDKVKNGFLQEMSGGGKRQKEAEKKVNQ